MNREQEQILSGIRYGLREELPKNTEELKKKNILQAISIDMELNLGLFTKDEISIIIGDIKEKHINNNSTIKSKIKKLK